MRRALSFAALLLAGSCGGGSPVSPTPTYTGPRAIVLNSGPYTFSLSFSPSGLPVCQNNFCTSTSLCIGTPAAVSSQYAVTLTRSGDDATITVPGTSEPLVLTLHVGATSVSGTIAGSARDNSGVTVSVTGAVTGAAPSNTAIAVSGNIDGQMNVPGGSCSNNGHAWSLAPR